VDVRKGAPYLLRAYFRKNGVREKKQMQTPEEGGRGRSYCREETQSQDLKADEEGEEHELNTLPVREKEGGLGL